MDLIDILLGLLGLYLVIASYYVVKKDKLILLAMGYTYIEGRKVTNIKKLESDIAKSSRFLGIALIICFIAKVIYYHNIIDIFQWIFIIKYCIETYMINLNIRKEKYEDK